jgi:hypothetical protein
LLPLAGIAPPLGNGVQVVLTDENTTISAPDSVGIVTIHFASDIVNTDGTSIILNSDSETGDLFEEVFQRDLVVLAETGGPQDLSQYFGFEANSGMVVVQSDTPEPPALPVFLTGLGLMTLLAWHRKAHWA